LPLPTPPSSTCANVGLSITSGIGKFAGLTEVAQGVSFGRNAAVPTMMSVTFFRGECGDVVGWPATA